MTTVEFDQWFRHHRGNFPSIDAWLAGLKTRRAGVTEGDVLRSWERCLQDVALAAAKEASDRLLRGDEELPRSFDEHPRTIRRMALARTRRAERRYELGKWHPVLKEWVYDCPRCGDTGLLSVYPPKSIKLARAGQWDEALRQPTVCVKCDCHRGAYVKLDCISFNARLHAVYSVMPAEARANLETVALAPDAAEIKYGAQDFGSYADARSEGF